jgi:predicted RNA-binding protein with PIN domain
VNYIVDGNNVLFAARHVVPGSAIGRHHLCAIVGAWASEANCSVTIVFDGPPPRPAVVEQMHQTGVSIAFSGARSADDVIQDIIDAANSPANLCVVSSDRAVESAARHRACRRLKSGDFIAQVATKAPGPTAQEQKPLEKPDESAPADTDEWLRHFGLEDTGGEESDWPD